MFNKKLSFGSLVIGAPAKINLFLQVLRRRPDGYHEINSAFQAVSLFARMRFELTDTGRIHIELAGPVDLPSDEGNLIARAYQVLHEPRRSLGKRSVGKEPSDDVPRLSPSGDLQTVDQPRAILAVRRRLSRKYLHGQEMVRRRGHHQRP